MLKYIKDSKGLVLATERKFCEENIEIKLEEDSERNLVPNNIVKGKTILGVEGKVYPLSSFVESGGDMDIKASDLDGASSIRDYAFYANYKLVGIEIPEGVSTIGIWSFYCCDKLSNIVLPSTVESIGHRAFSLNQSSAKTPCSITVKAQIPPRLGNDVFTDRENFTIYVPKGCANTYKKSWSAYANYITETTEA